MDVEALHYAARLQREAEEEHERRLGSYHQNAEHGKGKAPALPYNLHAAAQGGDSAMETGEASSYHSLQLASQLQQEFEREDEEVGRQTQLLKQSMPTFACGICMDDFDKDMVARIEPCGHCFCRDCAREYVSTKIKAQSYPILCPVCSTEKDRAKPGSMCLIMILPVPH